MKNQNRSMASYAAVCVRLAGGAALTLCLAQCSAEQPSSDGSEDNIGSVRESLVTYPHCGGIACTGLSQCQTNLPLCAIPISATCLPNPPRECAWKLNVSGSCPCMEHDVRHCNLNPTTGGVQICTANADRTATFWAACEATPVCNP